MNDGTKRTESQVKKYIYDTVTIPARDDRKLHDELRDRGENGWLMCGAISEHVLGEYFHTFYFVSEEEENDRKDGDE